MARPCPRTVDAPIRFVGLEPEDWGLVSTVFMFFVFFWTPGVGVLVAVAAGILIRMLKRGQPPGIVRHRLWAWGLRPIRGCPPPPGPHGTLWSPWA